VAVTTSSFESNFCPASEFFKFGNKKKSHGAKSGEYGGPIRSPIRPVWPWQERKCEPVRCHDGRALFCSPNAAVCSAIRRRIGAIIRHSEALWPFCPSTGSRCRSHLVNPKKRWPSPFRPMGQSLPSSPGEFYCFAAPIAPTAFSCPKFHAGYYPRGLFTCLAVTCQLSRVSSIGGLPIRDREFLSQESNHRLTLLFLHFSKIRGHVRFHTQSKQNYESDSAEISTVALTRMYYTIVNFSCDSDAIGRWG